MVKFDYMDGNFRNISFEADNSLNEDEVFELWSRIPVDTKEVPVFQVDIEYDNGDLTMYIYIENDDKDAFSDETWTLVKNLEKWEYDCGISDEDYDCDVITVYFTYDHLDQCRKAIYERSLRVCPECGEEKAEPHFSKWVGDRELFKYHCTNCHYTYVGLGNGKFIREGDLLSDYELQIMWESCH